MSHRSDMSFGCRALGQVDGPGIQPPDGRLDVLGEALGQGRARHAGTDVVETAQFVVIEGRHEQRRQIRSLFTIRSITQHTGDGQGGAGALKFDVDHYVLGYEIEHLLQRRDGLAGPGVEASEFGKAQFAYPAGAIGGAIDAFVVNDDDLGLRHVDIKLHAVDTEVDRAGEPGQRVLGQQARGTPVSDDQQGFDARAQARSAGSPVVCVNMPPS